MHKRATYKQFHSIYDLLTDAYYGAGRFLDGSGLHRHERESDNSYNRRKERAYYLNYTGPIVNASVDPIFKNEIKREYKETPLFSAFLDNVDRVGTDLQDYIRRTAIFAKLYTVVYIVVDNVGINSLSPSMINNAKRRNVPFLTHVLPEDVVHWTFDSSGIMTEFEYRERIKNADGVTETKHYSWTPGEWVISDQAGGIIDAGENPLGRVPVVQWFGRSHDVKDVMPIPEFISVAQANDHLYQLCSMKDQILDQQTFSILTMPMDSNQPEVTIGVNNVLTYPPESAHTPSYIAPDSGPVASLADDIKQTINEMYRMSGLDSVIGVQTTKSGVAKQWEFERTNQRLVDFALHCEKAEKDIICLYEEWTGEDLGYSCEYQRDFKISDVTEVLTQAQQAFDLGIESKAFRVEVAKKVMDGYLPNVESDIYDEMIKEVEEAESRVAEDKAFNDQGVDDGDASGADGENAAGV